MSDRDERLRLAQSVRAACLEAARTAYETGGYGGLCAEGRWELVLDALRSLPLESLVASEDEPSP